MLAPPSRARTESRKRLSVSPGKCYTPRMTERYSLEKAQEEAELLKNKVESGEALDYTSASNALESEPEQRSPSDILDEIFDKTWSPSSERIRKLEAAFVQAYPSAIVRFDPSIQIKTERKLESLPPDKREKFSKIVGKNNNRFGLASYQLYDLASVMRGHAIGEEHPLDEIREAVKGKKILIVGDDVGSLSEALNLLGASAYGIEYSKTEVEIAHAGVLSVDGKHQSQVIEGSAWDLIDENSDLVRTIREHGPFDYIFSSGVLNAGSGFDSGIKDFEKYNKWYGYLDDLLSEGGFQFHESVERDYRPFNGASMMWTHANDEYFSKLRDYLKSKPEYEQALKKLEDLQKNSAFRNRYQVLARKGSMQFLKKRVGLKIDEPRQR